MGEFKYTDYLRRRISPEETLNDLLSFPRYLEIETVNTCNARCPMCTIDEWTRQSPTMKDDLYARIVDEIREHSAEMQRVSLYRDGEPLLDKKLPDRINMLKSVNVPTVSIATNVSLLNEERAKRILEAGIDHVILSIDSLKKEVFEGIRVRLNFEQVLENALRFIELRNKFRPQTQIVIRMIRQETNFDEWPSYNQFWADKVAAHDKVYFHNLHNWGDQLSGFESTDKSNEHIFPCVALWSLMVIFANGDVPMCNVDYNNKFPTGNLLEASIQELWTSEVMKSRREMHFTGNKDLIAPCGNCNVWDEGRVEG